ncbi:hypothetical protein M3204_16860 [Mesobacillus subterraneus]|uniref:AlkZ-related protein n=1 Tax=Mesobacillus subterraneus TaxID=285983 RepID=UPI0020405483|nr:hypothetical protein [Mesobacillus subterraneus]MCM3666091.1 hypothetical protein [Mesobacillus subterraneus]MCM3685089.1 hypothetical protein [Mesobacillus subterraneus]
MKYYKIKTYEEAIQVIEEVGFLPLAPLVPEFPALNTITAPESWHSDTEYDPWIWRTRFSVDGVAGYGKFMKKKSSLISRDFLPCFKAILGSYETVEDRYQKGHVSKEALSLYRVISENGVIDTRELRTLAGLRDKEYKKVFDNALVELQGTMDIVISGIKEKVNAVGEKNGWSSTSFETYDSWASRNNIEAKTVEEEMAREYLLNHFNRVASENAVKKLEKLLS